MELPSEAQIRWILHHTAMLLELGAEPVRGLVTPTPEFFPDAFDGSPKAVEALLKRVQAHAGLSHLEVALSIVAPEGEEAQGGSCGSGGCGGGGAMVDTRVERFAARADGSYAVGVAAGEVRSPVVLTTALVRAVAAMFLAESGGFDEMRPAEREPAVDLAAVLLGFGVLVGNGSYIYKKGCGGVAVHSATKMPVDEIALALAVFCKLHDVSDGAAAKHLELTPRAHFEESSVWASSNASLVRKLRSRPEAILSDDYSLSPARSWLARALGVGKKKAASPGEEIDELERALATEAAAKRDAAGRRPVDPEKAKRLAEIKALLDEG